MQSTLRFGVSGGAEGFKNRENIPFDGSRCKTAAIVLYALWGRMPSCGRLSIGLPVGLPSSEEGRLTIDLQDGILPHKAESPKTHNYHGAEMRRSGAKL